MASVSSTSSLGNTALRGFGGMASGIDRDSIIEKMTLGTTTKINNQKKKITELQWKQEAYRGISDKIIDWADTYASYASSKNLKDATVFSKNQITVKGAETSTRFVSATGSSSMVNNVSLLGVKQMATSTVLRSAKHSNQGGEGLATTIDNLFADVNTSNLKGKKMNFSIYGTEGQVISSASFTFVESFKYTDKDGNEQTETIDYSEDDLDTIVSKLNHYLTTLEGGQKVGDTSIEDFFEFDTSDDGKHIVLQAKDGVNVPEGVKLEGNALAALGLGDGQKTDGKVNFETGSKITMEQDFETAAINSRKMIDYLTEDKLTFNFDGSQKSIQLITEDEAKTIKEAVANGTMTEDEAKTKVAENLQKRLNQAFGTNAVKVKFDADNSLRFDTDNPGSTLSVTSNNYEMLNRMGISYGASNKVNLEGTLSQSALLGTDAPKTDAEMVLTINGVTIEGLKANSSVKEILSKINSTAEAGVKATYIESTGEFMLVSSETGKGREINLDSDLAKKLFSGGGVNDKGEDIGLTKGQNAQILVSYGGANVMVERSSNTFNLEGLSVTVSGEFGDVKETSEGSGEWTSDTSQAITFSAKADVEGALEKVKSFIEDYNALVTEINTQVTTRPDRNYGALTDEKKDEMDETSIENWEKKAKQGILYGDSAMRDLSVDVQGVFTKMLNNGVSYEDLKEIGITYGEDWGDGGTLVFDESKFKTAMENDPEKVSNIFTGGGNVKKGLIDTIDETFTPYATRYGSKNNNGNGKGSYGRLIEIAGSEKKPTTLMENEIYKELEEMQKTIDSLNERLKVEQDRYISQFTMMESLINKMNTQSSYLSQLSA